MIEMRDTAAAISAMVAVGRPPYVACLAISRASSRICGKAASDIVCALVCKWRAMTLDRQGEITDAIFALLVGDRYCDGCMNEKPTS
jgi:hypothetical protein